MTMALKLLCRVIRNRISKGESLDSILKDYSKLTQAELAEIRATI